MCNRIANIKACRVVDCRVEWNCECVGVWAIQNISAEANLDE